MIVEIKPHQMNQIWVMSSKYREDIIPSANRSSGYAKRKKGNSVENKSLPIHRYCSTVQHIVRVRDHEEMITIGDSYSLPTRLEKHTTLSTLPIHTTSDIFPEMLGLLLLFFFPLFASSWKTGDRPSSADCIWKYIEQPLSHFSRGVANQTYQQRLCVYDNYWTPNQGLPVFFYTGNESPVDEYVNNTGLMWELAKTEKALIVFAEHRYFGESVPNIENMENCLSFLSSQEALADYASLTNLIRRTWGAEKSAFIAFGGSYGGMLASWMRMLYPSAIDGAIAASAPIWGLPLDSCPIDSSAQVVTYSASADAGAEPLCIQNLKSSYILLHDIGSTSAGRQYLSNQLNLCTPLESSQDIQQLLYYLQSPLFNLAEGSYPFPSSYITFALTGTHAELPPWAMQVLCSSLGADYSVTWEGDVENNSFTLSAKDVEITIDWDQTTNNGYSLEDVDKSGVLTLLQKAVQSIQVWYNVTQTLPGCINWDSNAPNQKNLKDKFPRNSLSRQSRFQKSIISARSPSTDTSNICTLPASEFDAGTGWNTLVCNEGINLVNWWAQGMGNDLYWPPNQPKGTTMESMISTSLLYCKYYESIGLYGLPRKADLFSKWLDTIYGGLRIQYATNIVFSNGNLDPWSPAGVTPTLRTKYFSNDESVVSLMIDMGGHHLDLFWSNENDPASVREVREIEILNIRKWIQEVAERNH